MYVVIREVTVRPGDEEQYRAARVDLNAIHRGYVGYRGSVTFAAGEGRRLSVNLWADEQAYQAAVPEMLAQAAQLMGPHLTGPSRVLYQGDVVADDLTNR
jgi:heme-degrading monooxygenase HmoA